MGMESRMNRRGTGLVAVASMVRTLCAIARSDRGDDGGETGSTALPPAPAPGAGTGAGAARDE